MKAFTNGRLGRIALCLAAAIALLSFGSLAESGATWGEPFSALPAFERDELTVSLGAARDMILDAHRECAVKSGWDAYPVEIVHTMVYAVDSFSDDCASAKQHEYYYNEAGSPCVRIVEFSTLTDCFSFGVATAHPASATFYADGSAQVLYIGSRLDYVRSRTYRSPLCPCMRTIDAGHAFDGVYSTDDAPAA
ncbi:MAG: hypothetical protein GX592_12630 [Clostridiales bacterium]|jgi:hypothetical protein|nr:hypothetical protein [Clostridiales bacterium]